MISTSDFRNGLTFKYEGELWQIREFLHVKPGKGGAFVRTKLVNLRTGQVLEKTFRSGEKFEEIRLEDRPMQYLYASGDEAVFMDNQTYEQLHIPFSRLENVKGFLKEGMDVTVQMVDNEVIQVVLPSFVELEVAQTDPGVKGDTATGGTKPATLETGAVIQVPLFVSEGDKVKIDTRTGEYVERVS